MEGEWFYCFKKLLHNEDGQALVEFAICLPVFLAFVYGLFGLFWWGTTALITQEVSHEVARKYAVTMNRPDAKKLGETYLGRWGYIFIETDSINVDVKSIGDKAVSTVTVKPRITHLYLYQITTISRSSSCVLERVWRERSKYL